MPKASPHRLVWHSFSCPFKGIVSQDFVVCFLVSFDRPDISKHQERVLLLLKSSFSYRNFRFSFQAVVSLLCEWSWAIRISAANVIAPFWEPKAAPMQMLFWRNNIEAGHTPSPGLFTTIRSSFYMFKIWRHFS
jgi:hypothetical protein